VVTVLMKLLLLQIHEMSVRVQPVPLMPLTMAGC
jgi:hypothetical protein